MSAKKTTKKTIAFGMFKGAEVTMTRKKAKEGNVIVKFSDKEIEIDKTLIK